MNTPEEIYLSFPDEAMMNDVADIMGRNGWDGLAATVRSARDALGYFRSNQPAVPTASGATREVLTFEQGYICAVANLLRQHGNVTMAKDLMDGVPHVNWESIDAYDRDEINRHGLLPAFRKSAPATRPAAAQEGVRVEFGVWIPVTDKMPADRQRVLVAHLNGSHIWRAIATYWPAGTMDASMWDDPPDEWWDDDGNKCVCPNAGWWEECFATEGASILANVTHWMPLPSSPNVRAMSSQPEGRG